MIEHGKIVNIEDGCAKVEIKEHEECKNCKLCSAIGKKRVLEVKLDSEQHFQIGQEVAVEINSKETLLGGFAVFIAPLIGFIVGATLGTRIFALLGLKIEDNLEALTAGLVFMGFTIIAAVIIYRSETKKNKLLPKLRRL